ADLGSSASAPQPVRHWAGQPRASEMGNAPLNETTRLCTGPVAPPEHGMTPLSRPAPLNSQRASEMEQRAYELAGDALNFSHCDSAQPARL
ncbi:hypothetical protein CYMTET_25989, partial [Cymbomonas tetramitiformis]